LDTGGDGVSRGAQKKKVNGNKQAFNLATCDLETWSVLPVLGCLWSRVLTWCGRGRPLLQQIADFREQLLVFRQRWRSDCLFLLLLRDPPQKLENEDK